MAGRSTRVLGSIATNEGGFFERWDRQTATILNSRERIMQASASRREGIISSADQLRLSCRALRSAPVPCAEIRLRSVQSSHPYGRRNLGQGRGQADR